MTKHQQHTPGPWTCDYNPYRSQDGREIPAFEIIDADGTKLFDTNEDLPAVVQEKNAVLASAAPVLLEAALEAARILADYEDAEDEGAVYRMLCEAIAKARAA